MPRTLKGPFIVDIELARRGRCSSIFLARITRPVWGSEKAVEHPLGLFRREKDLFVTRNFSKRAFPRKYRKSTRRTAVENLLRNH